MNDYRELMGAVGMAIDALGVVVIVIGAIYATVRFVFQQSRSYQLFRLNLGRAILLGLEFLIAGDIIRTVVVAPTMENMLVLGMIVLIRTFLSTAIQFELEGRWPWQTASMQPQRHND